MTASETDTVGDPDIRQFGTVVDLFDHVGRAHAGNTALIAGEDRINYGEYHRSAALLAGRLREIGVRDGARVVVVRGSSIETSISAHAVWAAGGQTALLNPLYTEREFSLLLADVEPVAILCDDPFLEFLRPLAQSLKIPTVLAFGKDELTTREMRAGPPVELPEPRPAPADAAALIYTGGTTGLPKAAFHRHEHLLAMVCQHQQTWRLAEPGNVVLNVAPQSHIWGFAMTLMSPLAGGNAVVLIPRFDPVTVLEALVRHKVTIFTGGPATIYHALMGLPEITEADLSHLKRCFGGGSPFAAGTLEAWKRLTDVDLLEGSGMTEGAPLTGNPLGGPSHAGSAGVVVPDTEIKVVDLEGGGRTLAVGETGELCYRGPQIVNHYWKKPEETADTFRDGWLHTGDIGYLDSQGRVFIVDRKKDMVIVSGYNVYPREIDEVLFAHPQVVEAAAVGVPDDHRGEVLHAYVVPGPGAALDVEEIMRYCEQNLAKYKVPASITVAEALPKTATNKIDKIALRKMARGE